MDVNSPGAGASQTADRDSAEHYVWGHACDGWRLLAREDLSVIEERVPAGAAEVRHVHDHARQFFYILAGRARLEFDDMTVEFGQGQGVHVAPGVAHRFVNAGSDDVTFLVVSAPSTRGDRRDLPDH